MKERNILFCLALLLGSTLFFSCSKMDDYKKFVEGGELIYPTKLDSIQIFSGRNRVQVQGVISANRGLSSFRVFWNNRADSVIVPVKLTEGIDTLLHIIDNLSEGPMNFEVRSYDDKGNSSIPTFIVGNIYGDRFKEGITQRSIIQTTFMPEHRVNMDLQDVSKEMGVYGVRVKYQSRLNKMIDTLIRTDDVDATLVLPDIVPGRDLMYATVYKPETLSIDTFMVNFTGLRLAGDVSNMFMKNFKVPFFAEEFDGERWGTLADWETNSNMKNHNGMGGYAADDDGVVHIEAGWGSPSVENGKIYQNIKLPAGKYKFSTNVSWANSDDPPAYLVISSGTEIPNYDDVSHETTIGFTKVNQHGFEFELKEEMDVSIGLVVMMYPDDFLRITEFKLEIL